MYTSVDKHFILDRFMKRQATNDFKSKNCIIEKQGQKKCMSFLAGEAYNLLQTLHSQKTVTTVAIKG